MIVKKWLPYALWDLPGLQNWLNQLSAEGWRLVRWPHRSFFLGRVSFAQDPQAVHSRYCLDPIWERIGTLELEDRSASYREAGWHYVDKIGKLYAIYRCDDPEAPDLYSDPQSLSWAMKRQLRWSWCTLCLALLWLGLLFRKEWPLLLHQPAKFRSLLILKADVLLPTYTFLLILALFVVCYEIFALRGIYRTRSYLNRGVWPPAGPKHYPQAVRDLASSIVLILFLVQLVYLWGSGTFLRSTPLDEPEDWNFPHVTLEEVLPQGARFRPYSPQELLHINTFDHSCLAPEQYRLAQGGQLFPDKELSLRQTTIRTLSPTLSRWVYEGFVEAWRYSLEGELLLHESQDWFQEKVVDHPGLDALTRFSYSDSTNVDYMGQAGQWAFLLHCSGPLDSDAVLDLLTQRLAQANTGE